MSPTFEELIQHGLAHGLTDDAAFAYAVLMWWGADYNYPPTPIVSGRRDPHRQRSLRERWLRGDRAGLVAEPALRSSHTEGTGFDLQRVPHLWVYGALAPHVPMRWGGNFRRPDPVHFDLGTHV